MRFGRWSFRSIYTTSALTTEPRLESVELWRALRKLRELRGREWTHPRGTAAAPPGSTSDALWYVSAASGGLPAGRALPLLSKQKQQQDRSQAGATWA